MLSYKRGEGYMVEQGNDTVGSEQKKTRPWVLIGNTDLNKKRRVAIAVPLTTSAPESQPLSVSVYFNNKNVVAIIDQIRSLSKNRFIQFEGELTQHDMGQIDDCL